MSAQAYDIEAHRPAFNTYINAKYKNSNRATVITRVEGVKIIDSVQINFKNVTPQFKHRVLKIRKFDLIQVVCIILQLVPNGVKKFTKSPSSILSIFSKLFTKYIV
jgi:hypothetical protein